MNFQFVSYPIACDHILLRMYIEKLQEKSMQGGNDLRRQRPNHTVLPERQVRSGQVRSGYIVNSTARYRIMSLPRTVHYLGG
jgi:hypothetical protein